MKLTRKEIVLQGALCSWISAKYPKILFRSMPNDVYKAKKTQDGRSHPDTIILKACGGWHGLAIEFKDEYSKVYRQDRTYKKNKHLQDQIDCMRQYSNEGYLAAFVWEINQGIRIVEQYLLQVDPYLKPKSP